MKIKKNLILNFLIVGLLLLSVYNISKFSFLFSGMFHSWVNTIKDSFLFENHFEISNEIDSIRLFAFQANEKISLKKLTDEKSLVIIVSRSNCSKCIRVRGLKERLSKRLVDYEKNPVYLLTGSVNRGVLTRWARQQQIDYKDVLIDSGFDFITKIGLKRLPALLYFDKDRGGIKNLKM